MSLKSEPVSRDLKWGTVSQTGKGEGCPTGSEQQVELRAEGGMLLAGRRKSKKATSDHVLGIKAEMGRTRKHRTD